MNLFESKFVKTLVFIAAIALITIPLYACGSGGDDGDGGPDAPVSSPTTTTTNPPPEKD